MSELTGSGKLDNVVELTTDEKRDAVREYVEENREDTQAEIASDLGVGRVTVTRAIEPLEDSGKLVQVNELSTDEKRAIVRECVTLQLVLG